MSVVTGKTGAVALGAALLLGAALSALPAQAEYVVTLEQVGNNVVATGSGTIDLAGLTYFTNGNSSAGIEPDLGLIYTGSVGIPVDIYSGLTGPANFGSGGGVAASSGSGDFVGAAGDYLIVPSGYVSGSPLSDTATYDNATFASLGVTPGTYTWSWGSGADADSFVLDIGGVPVPEPSALAVFGVALIGLALVRWRFTAPRSA